MMKYIKCDTSVGFSSLAAAECEVPTYDKNEEVLIQIKATACNRADLLQVSGYCYFCFIYLYFSYRALENTHHQKV